MPKSPGERRFPSGGWTSIGGWAASFPVPAHNTQDPQDRKIRIFRFLNARVAERANVPASLEESIDSHDFVASGPASYHPRVFPESPHLWPSFRFMKLLITGICGFVGSTLARAIRETHPGWDLVGIDNFCRIGSERNRLLIEKELGIEFHRGDIRNPSDLETLPRCDHVIDAAANPTVLAGLDGKTSTRQLVEHNLGAP